MAGLVELNRTAVREVEGSTKPGGAAEDELPAEALSTASRSLGALYLRTKGGQQGTPLSRSREELVDKGGCCEEPWTWTKQPCRQNEGRCVGDQGRTRVRVCLRWAEG